MTRFRLLAALAGSVVLVGLGVGEFAAQQPGAPVMTGPRPGRNIAVIDISYIFKNHFRFKREMEQMRADVEQAESLAKKERDAINGMVEELKTLKPGTQAYNEMDEMILKRQKDLEARVIVQRKEFLLREAKIYYTVYQEITQEVEYYANQAGLAMVFRFNGDPVNGDQPDDVLRDINKGVVYYAKDLDITPIILQRLNMRSGGNMGPVGDTRGSLPRLPSPSASPTPNYR